MSTVDSGRPWVRPLLDKYGPDRRAGGFYRTADRTTRAGGGGVPLTDADDAVVAAVRLAYKVASAQVDRSTRLANRLRAAGTRALGKDSERQALDAAESLVFRSMLGGLSWLESAAADRESPIKRLLAAEYRMLGAMMGLAPARRDDAAAPGKPARKASASRAGRADAAIEDWQVPTRSRSLTIRHKGKHRRAVRVVTCDLGAVANLVPTRVFFYSLEEAGISFDASLNVTSRRDATLVVDTPADAQPGLWRAAVCLEDGTQVGSIDLEL